MNAKPRAMGELQLVGPMVEASYCQRGQLCSLSLTAPRGADWTNRLPISRVLVGTGNCGTNLTLVYSFPSNISGEVLSATPGVSERYKIWTPGIYQFSGTTGLVEPGAYVLCWCVIQATVFCETHADFHTSANIGALYIVGPLTPTVHHPCWRAKA